MENYKHLVELELSGYCVPLAQISSSYRRLDIGQFSWDTVYLRMFRRPGVTNEHQLNTWRELSTNSALTYTAC